jgi:cell division protein ZapA
MPQVKVTINGRQYRMACDEGEQDRLIGLARRFDDAITSLRGEFGEIGDLRLAVMAGIMVTDQLSEAERRLAQGGIAVPAALDAEVESELARRLDAAAERIERLAADIAEQNAG